jgi:tetratricopeptide (TPR) repeat protein
LQRASVHFKRFIELSPDAGSRAQGLDNLVETYLPAGLNQPGEAEPYARALVAAAPTWPQSYRQLAAVLRALGQTDAATKVLTDARASIPPDGRGNYVAHLKAHVTESPGLSGDAAKQVIDIALAVNQEDLAATGMNYGNLTHKADLLELLATRVEGSVARQNALRAESARLHVDAAKAAAQLFKTGRQ